MKALRYIQYFLYGMYWRERTRGGSVFYAASSAALFFIFVLVTNILAFFGTVGLAVPIQYAQLMDWFRSVSHTLEWKLGFFAAFGTSSVLVYKAFARRLPEIEARVTKSGWSERECFRFAMKYAVISGAYLIWVFIIQIFVF